LADPGGAAAAGPQARAHAAAPAGPFQECVSARAWRRGASRLAVPRPPLYGARLAHAHQALPSPAVSACRWRSAGGGRACARP